MIGCREAPPHCPRGLTYKGLLAACASRQWARTVLPFIGVLTAIVFLIIYSAWRPREEVGNCRMKSRGLLRRRGKRGKARARDRAREIDKETLCVCVCVSEHSMCRSDARVCQANTPLNEQGPTLPLFSRQFQVAHPVKLGREVWLDLCWPTLFCEVSPCQEDVGAWHPTKLDTCAGAGMLNS